MLCTLYSKVGTLQRSLHVCKINTEGLENTMEGVEPGTDVFGVAVRIGIFSLPLISTHFAILICFDVLALGECHSSRKL